MLPSPTSKALLALCAGLLLAAPVGGGTAVRMELPALVEGADLILEGRVLRRRGVLDPARERIETEYVLAVGRTFQGEPLATRTVRLPGGVLPDGRGMVLPGLPELAVGEEAILFLARADAAGMRMPVGLAQGRFRVVTSATGVRSLVREQADLHLLDPRTGVVSPAPHSAVFDYAATVEGIERAVAARRARLHGGGR